MFSDMLTTLATISVLSCIVAAICNLRCDDFFMLLRCDWSRYDTICLNGPPSCTIWFEFYHENLIVQSAVVVYGGSVEVIFLNNLENWAKLHNEINN